MEDKKNAVIVVDFGQNTFGGYFIKYSDGSTIDPPIDDDGATTFEDITPIKDFNPYNPSYYTGGDYVKIKNRLPERIGDGMFGYWDIDEKATEKLINLYGQYLRILESRFLNVPSSNYEIKC